MLKEDHRRAVSSVAYREDDFEYEQTQLVIWQPSKPVLLLEVGDVVVRDIGPFERYI